MLSKKFQFKVFSNPYSFVKKIKVKVTKIFKTEANFRMEAKNLHVAEENLTRRARMLQVKNQL